MQGRGVAHRYYINVARVPSGRSCVYIYAYAYTSSVLFRRPTKARWHRIYLTNRERKFSCGRRGAPIYSSVALDSNYKENYRKIVQIGLGKRINTCVGAQKAKAIIPDNWIEKCIYFEANMKLFVLLEKYKASLQPNLADSGGVNTLIFSKRH